MMVGMPERSNGLAAKGGSLQAGSHTGFRGQQPVGEPEPLRARGFESHSLPYQNAKQGVKSQRMSDQTGAGPALQKCHISTSELRLSEDFDSAPRWEDLAKERGLRLPRWSVRPTRGKVMVWLKKLHISRFAYLEWFGGPDLGSFAEYNPDWPLRALVGLLLEKQEEGKL